MKQDRIKHWLSSHPFIVISVLLCFVSYFDWQDYAILCFLVLCQVAIVASVYQACKLYYRTRKGVYVRGQLIESTEIEDSEEIKYNILIEFSYPENEKKYCIDYQSELRPTSFYTIWINQQVPDKSIVMEKVSNDLSKIVLGILFVFGLLYIDYLYILKIIGSK